MKPLLFLDIDGVLNSAVWFASMKERDWDRKPIHHMLDPEAVRRLNFIIAATGAEIVISSSWRIIHPLTSIADALKKRGFIGTIIGATGSGPGRRGNEIQAWLDAHSRSTRPFAILDDDSDMEHLLPRLVKTTWAKGLLDQHVPAAIELLLT
jgi:hypothetical protein